MWNFQHIIFIWRRKYWQILKTWYNINVINTEIRTVKSTVKIGQWGLHKLVALKRSRKGALMSSFCGAPCIKPSIRKTAKEMQFLLKLSKVLLNLSLRPSRSSHLQIFFKTDLLKIFSNFMGKHICMCLFLIKLQVWRPATLLREIGFFMWTLRKFTPYIKEHLQWRLQTLTVIALKHFTGAQPAIFRGRGGFLKYGQFDKRFVRETEEGKHFFGKNFVCLIQDTLKTAFSLIN